MEARYLGDGVYIQPWPDGGGLKMTTRSHLDKDAENTVYLEPAVLEQLDQYLTDYKEEIRRENSADGIHNPDVRQY